MEYGAASLLISVTKIKPFMVGDLKHASVKQALAAKGLPSKGKKAELIKQLEEYLISLQPTQEVIACKSCST